MIKKDKIKISKFVAEYKKQATDNLRDAYVKRTLDVAQYIPYQKKMLFAENIVETTSWLREDKKKVKIMINSPVKYLLYCRCVVEAYTNLEAETENWLEEYDLLNESGVLDVIFKMIPEKECNEFSTVLSMTYEDFITNNYEMHAFISGQVERFGNLTGIAIAPYLDKLSASITALDDSKIEKIGTLLSKFLK